MKKIINLGCILSIIFLMPGHGQARDYSLVEESSYGKAPYYNGAKKGSTIYAAGSNESLDIFDVSDATNVQLVDTVNVPCDISSMMIDEETLVIGCSFAVHFYDISAPQSPSLIGSYDSSSYAVNGIYLEGDRFYMAGGNSDIIVFDATHLSNLSELGSKTLSSFNNGRLHKSGDHLYFVEEFKRVNFYNVADPSNIRKTSEYQTFGPAFYDAVAIENYLYIGTGVGLQVVDISDKSSPTLLRNIVDDVDRGSFEAMPAINMTNDVVVTGSFTGDLYQFDITDKANPSYLGGVDDGTNSYIYNLFFENDVVTTVSGVSGVSTFDFSTPKAVIELSNYTESVLPQALATTTDSLIVSDESNLFNIFKLNEADELKLVNKLPVNGSAGHPAGDGNFVWLGRNGFLRTYDMSVPESPIQLDEQLTLKTHSDISFSKIVGDKLLLGLNSAEVRIYDVSAIIPSLLMSINLGVNDENAYYFIGDIEMADNYLIVSSSGGEIFTIDISDYNSPKVMSQNNWTALYNFYLDIMVANDQLYMAGSDGVLIADISNLSKPTFKGALENISHADAIYRFSDEFVIISSTNGLILATLTDGDLNIIHQLEGFERLLRVANFKGRVIGSVAYQSELKVVSINKAPQSTDYDITLEEDSSISDFVEANDETGDAISYSIYEAEVNGQLEFSSSGAFTYSPNQNFNGTAYFIYKAEDEHGGSSLGKVTFTVTAVNDAPVAQSRTASTRLNSSVSGVLSALDADGDTLTYTITKQPTNGAVSLNGSNFTYTPTSDYTGSDSFDFKVEDPSGESSEASVSITVSEPPSSGGGGGAIPWLTLILMGLFAYYRRVKLLPTVYRK